MEAGGGEGSLRFFQGYAEFNYFYDNIEMTFALLTFALMGQSSDEHKCLSGAQGSGAEWIVRNYLFRGERGSLQRPVPVKNVQPEEINICPIFTIAHVTSASTPVVISCRV
jgi:hypothetical protein